MLSLLLALSIGPRGLRAQEGLIDGGLVNHNGHCDLLSCDGSTCDGRCKVDCESFASEDELGWLHDVKVGYDSGFVIASKREVDLKTASFPFRFQFNGWAQLRYAHSDFAPPNSDLNQFQFQRSRLVFSGHAFNPDLYYFAQLDGRSSSGSNVRMLDYFLRYDFGHDQLGLEKGTIGIRAGKYKMPFTMARWMSGQQFEFTDRSVASIYFDINRSLAWGLYGQTKRLRVPIEWETAIFNGFRTGGTSTGSSGGLDENFAYSMRLRSYPIGTWGVGQLADLEGHDQLAMRVGCGFASTSINRDGATEFNTLRVVDSGNNLANILPATVDSYAVNQFAVDASLKLRGWSTTLEYYFRNVSDFRGAAVPDLLDHGFWFQLGYFVVPGKFQLLSRWSRVDGNSGTLGASNQSSDEIAGGFAWYFRGNQAKFVSDLTHLDGAPIRSSALDIAPGDRGWLYRTQVQISF